MTHADFIPDDVRRSQVRAEVISRAIRDKFFYTVKAAGSRIGLSRAQAYRAVALK